MGDGRVLLLLLVLVCVYVCVCIKEKEMARKHKALAVCHPGEHSWYPHSVWYIACTHSPGHPAYHCVNIFMGL